MLLNCGTKTKGTALGADHSFADLATEHPWLADVELWARNAKLETVDDLHNAFFHVHTATARQPFPDSIIADSHLCKLLDDRAELSCAEVTE